MATKEQKPKIRFAEFTDHWQRREFGKLISEYSDKTVIENEDVLLSCAIEGMYLNSELFSHQRGSSNIGYLKIKKGDLILSAQNLHLGNANVNLRFEHGIISPAYKVYDVTGCISEFLSVWVKKDTTKRFFLDATTAGASLCRKNIEWETLYSQKLSLPCDLEQRKIAEFFICVEQLLAEKQRKFGKLQNLKKSMLEKMFPKDGSNVPEIRFAGFTGAWKEYAFKDITYPSGIRNRDNLLYDSYSITNDNGFVPQDEQFENGGTMKDADKRMYIIVSPQSFAYNPARINVGSIGYQNLKNNVIVSSLYEVFKTSDIVNDSFLWQWFKSSTFHKMIEKYQEGGVRLYFYYDKLCMGSILLPTVVEQAQIGQYLDNLDNLITLHHQELERLKNLKKALLEKMFV